LISQTYLSQLKSTFPVPSSESWISSPTSAMDLSLAS